MTEPGRIQSDDPTTPFDPGSPVEEAAPSEAAAADDDAAIPPSPDPDDTVGTGSAIALGCIVGTLLLIVVGLAFLALLAFLN